MLPGQPVVDRVAWAVWCAIALALVRPAAGAVRLNEVFYDPAGADSGFEFVELAVTGAGVAQSRLRLERGNGARPQDWTEVWRGAAGDTMPAGTLFVIGEALVTPRPAVVTTLALQNGPDACRLWMDGVVVDLVGWGDHTYAEYYETQAAADVPSGISLGRRPGAPDVDDNAQDFLPLAEPSPAQPNRVPLGVTLTPLRHYPLGLGHRVTFELRWNAEPHVLPLEVRLNAVLSGDAAPPWSGAYALTEAETDVVVTLEVPALGPFDWQAGWQTAAGRDSLQLRGRAGMGAVRITEFMAEPPSGEPEWVELTHAGAGAIDLTGFVLSDLAGTEATIGIGASWVRLRLEPGESLVVTERAFAPVAGPLVVVERWPSLNNGGDRITLVDGDGRTSDSVAYEGDWSRAGHALTRLGLDLPSSERQSWVPAAPATPGRGPEQVVGAPFLSFAEPVGPEGPLLMQLAEPLSGGVLRVFDLAGRCVFERRAGALAGRTQLTWDRRQAHGGLRPPALYLMELTGRRWRDSRPVWVRTVFGGRAR